MEDRVGKSHPDSQLAKEELDGEDPFDHVRHIFFTLGCAVLLALLLTLVVALFPSKVGGQTVGERVEEYVQFCDSLETAESILRTEVLWKMPERARNMFRKDRDCRSGKISFAIVAQKAEFYACDQGKLLSARFVVQGRTPEGRSIFILTPKAIKGVPRLEKPCQAKIEIRPPSR